MIKNRPWPFAMAFPAATDGLSLTLNFLGKVLPKCCDFTGIVCGMPHRSRQKECPRPCKILFAPLLTRSVDRINTTNQKSSLDDARPARFADETSK